MTNTILVPFAAELPSGHILDAALAIASKLTSHVHATYIRPEPSAAMASLPDVIVAAGVTATTIEHESAAHAARAKQQFEEWRNRNGGMATPDEADQTWVGNWSERTGDIETVVTRFGRIADFIVLPRPSSDNVVTQRCFDAAVFGTGRPVLVVGAAPPPPDLTDHIMIAWNGSLEASRALFAAMPLLRRANRITLFTALNYDEQAVDLEDVAASLREREIRTPAVLFPTGEHSAGVALVDAAKEHGASLIVMGAYTHSRLRALFLGGVTRHLLAHAPVPLLMSH